MLIKEATCWRGGIRALGLQPRSDTGSEMMGGLLNPLEPQFLPSHNPPNAVPYFLVFRAA